MVLLKSSLCRQTFLSKVKVDFVYLNYLPKCSYGTYANIQISLLYNLFKIANYFFG
jgi:hypothetical protein